MIEFAKRLLGGGAHPSLAPELRAAIEAWRALPVPPRDGLHFYTRYVVLDVSAAGLNSETDALLGIAGIGVTKGGILQPQDAFALDMPKTAEEEAALDRQLAALLRFIGKDPLVTFQAPFVQAFLQKVFAERLKLDFQPEWIDLAWLLPDLFNDRIDAQVSLDTWLDNFGIEVPGRCDAMSDAVAVGRLLLACLQRAGVRGIDSPGKLADTAKARRWLRHSG